MTVTTRRTYVLIAVQLHQQNKAPDSAVCEIRNNNTLTCSVLYINYNYDTCCKQRAQGHEKISMCVTISWVHHINFLFRVRRTNFVIFSTYFLWHLTKNSYILLMELPVQSQVDTGTNRKRWFCNVSTKIYRIPSSRWMNIQDQQETTHKYSPADLDAKISFLRSFQTP